MATTQTAEQKKASASPLPWTLMVLTFTTGLVDAVNTRPSPRKLTAAPHTHLTLPTLCSGSD